MFGVLIEFNTCSTDVRKLIKLWLSEREGIQLDFFLGEGKRANVLACGEIYVPTCLRVKVLKACQNFIFTFQCGISHANILT